MTDSPPCSLDGVVLACSGDVQDDGLCVDHGIFFEFWENELDGPAPCAEDEVLPAFATWLRSLEADVAEMDEKCPGAVLLLRWAGHKDA